MKTPKLRPMTRVVVPNTGKIVQAMMEAYGMPHIEMIAELRYLATRVSSSPQPRRRSGASELKRQSRRVKNIRARAAK